MKNLNGIKNIKQRVLIVALIAIFGTFGFNYISNRDINKTQETFAQSTSQSASDINRDGKIDIVDLSMLLSDWGKANSSTDIDNSGIVDIVDLSILLSNWGLVLDPIPTSDRGAQLPIQYDLSSLSGSVKYVSTQGSDSTGTGAINSPYATLEKAINSSPDGGNIVIRGGVYPISQRKMTLVHKPLNIMAYPGEIPEFNGSKRAPQNTSIDGDLRYFSYQPIPASDGSGMGITFSPAATFSGTTPTGLAAERGWRCVTGNITYTKTDPSSCNNKRVITGFWPDQVWVNGNQLIQVSDKNLVTKGKFYVPRSSSNDTNPSMSQLYMHKDDTVDMSKVYVSYSGGTIRNLDSSGWNTQGDFLRLYSANISIEGIRIKNHSPAWDSYAIRVMGQAVNAKIKNVEVISNANIAIHLLHAPNVTMDGVSLLGSSWMGLSGSGDDIKLYNSQLNSSNVHREFAPGPISGGAKIAASHGMIVKNSEFNDNYGFGLWYDVSNYRTIVANSSFMNNSHAALFYEISHDLLAINNYFVASTDKDSKFPLRLAASSSLKLINNTIIGGYEAAISVHADGRTKKYDSNGDGIPDRYCAEHDYRYGNKLGHPDYRIACINGMLSDTDKRRTGRYGAVNMTHGLNFQPSVDIMLNNVMRSDQQYRCAAVCVDGYSYWWESSRQMWVTASVMMDSIFHKARTETLDDPAVGETIVNGNIYQVPSGNIARFRSGIGINGFSPIDQRPEANFSAQGINLLRNQLASYPYNLAGSELTGKSANQGLVNNDGSITTNVNHNEATPIPNDPIINQYIPAGTRHYGSQIFQ